MRIVINKFAIDGTEVYGIADTGVYRLDTGGHNGNRLLCRGARGRGCPRYYER